MTEKEKMLAGILYDANNDKNLLKERMLCKDICFEYNNVKPSDTKTQELLIKKLLGKTKDNFSILAPFWCDYGYNIEIGENFFANHNCVILDCAKVTFGDNVFIAPDCGFYTAGHPLDYEHRNQGLEYAYPITVGNNVWIGAGVRVMPGVTIGDNVVIGAGSVVTKDIPSNKIAYGNPCKVVKDNKYVQNIEQVVYNIINSFLEGILLWKIKKKIYMTLSNMVLQKQQSKVIGK